MLICVGFLVCGLVALVTSIVYLVSVRPRLAQVMKFGNWPPPPYPPNYGYPPGGPAQR